MITVVFFTLSGTALVTITLSKRIEEKKKKTVFILRAISRGDERVRYFHHRALHVYSAGKDRFYFWITKQLPLRAKSLWNRFVVYVKERGEKYTGDIRNSRLLKKSDGISEFFKSISEIEKGNGEINDVYEEREVLVATEVVESVEPAPAIVPKKRSPRKKKITVKEVE